MRMATYIDVARVRYLCTCGQIFPHCWLWFCKHCVALRCSNCVTHEVDSAYCPNCLEGVSGSEARLKKNRCLNCFDCPSCQHTLSTRATSAQLPNPEEPGKTVTKKVYYLACGFCRWTSRDVGMKDQLVASGGWQAPSNPHDARMKDLLEHYHCLAVIEKMDAEKKKNLARQSQRMFSQYSVQDKYGILSPVVRLRHGMRPSSASGTPTKVSEVAESEAAFEIEPLPVSIFSEVPDETKATNIEQRLNQVDFQPSSVSDLHPSNKRMLVRKSQRCRECEHNLCKPEYSAVSIKFKIHLLAMYYIPEIRIEKLPERWIVDEASQVVLTISNPLHCLVHITLSPSTNTNVQQKSTAAFRLSSPLITLPAKNEADAFDDAMDADTENQFNNDGDLIVFRKSNKAGFKMSVTPAQTEGDVIIALTMKYDYVAAFPTAQAAKEPEPVELQQHVLVNFGKL